MEINVLNSDKKMVEFEISGVDYTLPQLLTEALNNDKDVEFAAYKLDHIVNARPRILVKTKKGDPVDVVVEKLEELKGQVADFRKHFKEALK